ncbi:fukutin [Caerostris darwini]|uniref:Fukutin n=1 Tax=Caerostris darwini TaxID=1538125 RepID=A0AAV4PXE6_9ARAC|nr:fukutin [Caerostris darwini]
MKRICFGRCYGESQVLETVSRIDTISSFSSAASDANVTVLLLEPSVLYKFLTYHQEALILKKGSKLSTFKISHTTLNFGVTYEYHNIITQDAFKAKMLLKGFHYVPSYKTCIYDSSKEQDVGHSFYTRSKWTVHLVEFVNESNYFWHSALPNDSCPMLPNREKFHFVENKGAFENLYADPLNNESNINLPSDPLNFLNQMRTSKFLDCHPILTTTKKHPHEDKVAFIIQEMKRILHPYLIDFWLTSGTLLGWYRECGMISYTTDVDFGMWAKDVQSVESLIKMFKSSESLKITTRFGFAEEALELSLNYKGLKTDIFFFYVEGKQAYVACHFSSSFSYMKVLYPKFTLCSAEFFQEKVLVPCETKKILLAEYGPEWAKPISEWNWKSSFSNKGPVIEWKESRRKDVYQFF